ncbi:hypothetical protein [Staphylococcus agnetis]|uniref:hypothetical protein n=1 Tax=Staphylococcus agnetis TaxID=985762 RepID=UPI0014052526|nr:hypothetical protein [Staphylococcus agnetis]NJI14356.1 hypothetical protein [Staphylococcus agnetis]QIN24523.1 hypothetical protein GJE18_07090 [Staphylococcus agnetis]
MNIKKKKHTNVGGLVDKPNFDHIETSELDIEKFLNRFKKEGDNMVKKATEKPREVEYIEFNGYENFEEVCEFVGCHYEGILLKVNRSGKEVIDIPRKGCFLVGTIFYRYLNPEYAHLSNHETGDYIYDVMPKDKFFCIYG